MEKHFIEFATFKNQLEGLEKEMVEKMTKMEKYFYLCFNDCESLLQIYGVITEKDMDGIIKKHYLKLFKEEVK